MSEKEQELIKIAMQEVKENGGTIYVSDWYRISLLDGCINMTIIS